MKKVLGALVVAGVSAGVQHFVRKHGGVQPAITRAKRNFATAGRKIKRGLDAAIESRQVA